MAIILIEWDDARRLAKRRLEREQGRKDATEDMSEDLSEGEKADPTPSETPNLKFPRISSDLHVWSDDNKRKRLYILLVRFDLKAFVRDATGMFRGIKNQEQFLDHVGNSHPMTTGPDLLYLQYSARLFERINGVLFIMYLLQKEPVVSSHGIGAFLLDNIPQLWLIMESCQSFQSIGWHAICVCDTLQAMIGPRRGPDILLGGYCLSGCLGIESPTITLI
eukprot:Gb_17919 [translate_table: standard]